MQDLDGKEYWEYRHGQLLDRIRELEELLKESLPYLSPNVPLQFGTPKEKYLVGRIKETLGIREPLRKNNEQ